MQAIGILDEDKRTREEAVKDPSFRFEFGLDRIKEFHGDKKISILDVGTGSGIFPLLCKDANVMAVESNEELREKVAKDGLPTFASVSKINKLKFDAITCFEVLEHQKEAPLDLLKEMYSKLKKPGILVFTVPFLDKVPDPDHKWYFDYYDIFDMASEVSPAFDIYLINKFRKLNKDLNLFACVIYRVQ